MPYKISEIDILIVAGSSAEDADHWTSRWVRGLKTAKRVGHTGIEAIAAEVRTATRPVVLVAHGHGVHAVLQAAPRLPKGKVAGAFLVAPPDLEPVPSDPLAFPSLLVASRNDPQISFERAHDLALDWGAAFVDAGEAGHFDSASGHGPWPEGLLRFGAFLKGLG